MINEDYCSYEVAKLLKEKGFPQEYDLYHSMVYNEEDYEDAYEVQRMVLQTRLVKAGTLSSYSVGIPEPKCYCPTHQMAMKWLREVHKIFIVIIPRLFYSDGSCDSFAYSIWADDNLDVDGEEEWDELYESYEQAVEAALKYSLENLI